MTESRFDPEEDAFNHVEMMSRVKQQTVKHQLDRLESEVANLKAKTQQEFYDELRNGVIEEVALAMQRMTGFGQDTLDSITIYIREMKK